MRNLYDSGFHKRLIVPDRQYRTDGPGPGMTAFLDKASIDQNPIDTPILNSSCNFAVS